MAELFLLPFVAAVFLAIVMRPEIIPDDLPPLPVVQAMATVALLVINIAVAASGLALAQATACRTGAILFAYPSFVAITTLVTAAALLCRRETGAKPGAELPYGLDDTIALFDQLSTSADRLGFTRIDFKIVDDDGPGLEVTGGRARAVTILVRRWLVDALRNRLTPAARASAPLLVRFAVHHEICHALNGDHRLYRVAQAAAFAQLWWLAGGIGLILLLVSSAAPCPTPAPLVLWLAGAFGLIAIACALHRRLAKAFVLRYEIRADARALAMLSQAEREELLDCSSGMTALGTAATRLARFLAFLECARPASLGPFMARLLRLVWPAPPMASARLSDRSGVDTRRDEQWALFGGLCAGVVLMSILIAFHAALEGAAVWTALAVAIPIPNAYFVVRSRRSMLGEESGDSELARRCLTAMGFLAGVFIGTLLTLVFFIAPLIAWPGISTSSNGLILLELLAWAGVTFVCLLTTTGGSSLTAAVETSFESWMTLIPFLFGCVFAAPLVGMVLAARHELWTTPRNAISPAMLAGFAGFLTSQLIWQWKSPLRALAPFALLDGSFPIFRYRLFWRNMHVDATRHSRIGSLALASAIVGLMLAVPALAAVVGAMVIFPQHVLEVLFGSSLLYLFVLAVLPVRRKAKKRQPITEDMIRLAARLLRLADLDPSMCVPELEMLRTRLRDVLRQHVIPPPRDEPSTPADIRRAVILVELARSAYADELIVRWRPRFVELLHRFSNGDSVISWPDGGPPSLTYTAWAHRLARLASLGSAEEMEHRIAVIESLAVDAARGTHPTITEAALVAGILRDEGRPPSFDLTEVWSRLVSLDSIRPLQSLADLQTIAASVDREPPMDRLRAITRSKLWETLQLNVVTEMDRLMDLYETALRLPLHDERLLEIARRAVRVATRELTSPIETTPPDGSSNARSRARHKKTSPFLKNRVHASVFRVIPYELCFAGGRRQAAR